MPLSRYLMPDPTRQQSDGRFVLVDMDKNISNAAALERNKLLTVVAEVLGVDTIAIDKTDQQVPKFRIRHVTAWEHDNTPSSGYTVPQPSGYGRHNY